MDGLNAITAAAWCQAIDGKQYWFEPLTLRDWGLIEQRITQRRPHPLEEAKTQLDGMAEADKRTLLEEALRRATAVSRASSDEVTQYLSTCEGAAFMFWLSIRKRHPEITEERATELLNRFGAENLRGLQSRIDGCAGIPAGTAKN